MPPELNTHSVPSSAPPGARGYVPIRDYAAIGDGRTVALVARDGSIDWLCLPDLDSPSVFAAVLDADRGGRFALQPEIAAQCERRYLPDTNVLETTFTTGAGGGPGHRRDGLPNAELGPTRELIRRVDGLAGRVPMRWRSPRLRLRRGGATTREPWRRPVATKARRAGGLFLGRGRGADRRRSDLWALRARESSSAVIALCAAHQEPLVFPRARRRGTLGGNDRVLARLGGPARVFRSVARGGDPQRTGAQAALHAPSGAIAAAASASLPEEIGGERNWDYRFCWVRDSAFTLERPAAARLPRRGRGLLLVAAARFTAHPPTPPGPVPAQRRRARTRADTRAGRLPRLAPGPGRQRRRAQTQLDIYGDLLQTALVYTQAGGRLDRETGQRLAGIADLVCHIWRQPDSGIWEVRSEPAALHPFQDDVLGGARPRRSPLPRRATIPRPRIDVAA